MIALAFALALFVPGPNDPVCDPAAGVVTECAQGQLPGEVIGREIGAGAPPREHGCADTPLPGGVRGADRCRGSAAPASDGYDCRAVGRLADV
jgi:hypothetical protein